MLEVLIICVVPFKSPKTSKTNQAYHLIQTLLKLNKNICYKKTNIQHDNTGDCLYIPASWIQQTNIIQPVNTIELR